MTTPLRPSFDSSTSLPSGSAVKSNALEFRFSHETSIPLTSSESAVPSGRKQEYPETGSFGKETKQKDDDRRNSFPTLPGISHTFSRRHGSDTSFSRGRMSGEMNRGEGELQAQRQKRLRSYSPSRGVSPLRILHQLSSTLHLGSWTSLEDPFVPIDPFKPKWTLPSRIVHHQSDLEKARKSASTNEDAASSSTLGTFFRDFRHLCVEILIREMYLNFLLRLPAMYFSRVARTFEDAEVSRPDMLRMINASGGGTRGSIVKNQNSDGLTTSADPATTSRMPTGAAAPVINTTLPLPDEWTPASVSPALIRFKHSWEAFIDSLVREWKTLNVVSALLASAILTVFQIPDAANDPVTRTGILLSLICSLMSLTYGCMYIVRFRQMGSMFHASRWAEETRKTKTSIWWNVWVLLATPAIWLAWAIVWFIASILSFVWRNGSVNDPITRPPLSSGDALCVRVIITAAIALGLVYMTLIIRTLKKYGSRNGASSVGLVGVNSIPDDVPQNTNDGVKVLQLNNEQKDDEMDHRGREMTRS